MSEKPKTSAWLFILYFALVCLIATGIFFLWQLKAYNDLLLKNEVTNPSKENCAVDSDCGSIVGVDCDTASGGPYYYLEKGTGRIICSTSGIVSDGYTKGTPCPEEVESCGKNPLLLTFNSFSNLLSGRAPN